LKERNKQAIFSDIEEGFMKKAFVFRFVLLLFAALLPAQTWLTGSVDDALAKAKAQGKLLLLDFFASSG
jgi:uncharacterized membrane protein